MKPHDAIKNKKTGRVGRVDILSQGRVLILYMNDGNRISPMWEWLADTEVESVADNLVAQHLLSIDEMPFKP